MESKELVSKNKIKKVNKLKREEQIMGLLFVAAPVIGLVVFLLGPMIYSLAASFTDWDGIGKMHFIGINNFIDMFQDGDFWRAFYNTIFYFIGIPINMGLSLLLAMALNRKIPGMKIFRTLYYIPVVSSAVAVSILWGWIYNSDFGLINQILSMIGIHGPAWLVDPGTVKPALIGMLVWQGVGAQMILYLAGLQNIPEVYYEAAAVDGANAFHKFRHITVPLITPISFYIMITLLIGGFQIYVPMAIMTPNGGTNYSSASIVMYLFNKGFGNGQMGYGSAVAWFLAVFIFIVTFIQFKFSSKWVETIN